MSNGRAKRPTVKRSQCFVGAGKHMGLKRPVSSDPIPKSEWKGLDQLEDGLELSAEFKAQIEQSEREMAQAKRPRVRRNF
jgi:hypothetical protein